MLNIWHGCVRVASALVCAVFACNNVRAHRIFRPGTVLAMPNARILHP
jgi:hypothetical protein